ncbi:ROK family glucokinase [Treponema sp.]
MRRVLAVDMGGTKTAVGLVSSDGKVLAKETFPTPLGEAGRLIEAIAEHAQNFIASNNEAAPEEAQIHSIGMSLPGVVDVQTGTLLVSPSSAWSNVPFSFLLEEALSLPVSSDNDVNACALAEARFGSGRGLESFFWFQVSTGIGGAIYTKGQVLSGKHSMAGEIGHLMVKRGGALCGCGHRGCLEAEAAGPAWRRKALIKLDSKSPEGLGCLAGLDPAKFDAKDLAVGARAGDNFCKELVAEIAENLAIGIAAVINILDPEALIIGGGVTASWDLLESPIKQALPQFVFASDRRSSDIRISALGYDAALIGAAALALEDPRQR